MSNPIADPSLWTVSAPSQSTPAWTGTNWQFVQVFDFIDSLAYKGALPSAAFSMLAVNTDPGSQTVAVSVVVDGVTTTYTIQPNAAPQQIAVSSAASSLVINAFAGSETTNLTLSQYPVPAPVPIDACEEYGRVTRAYVSGYQLNRVHKSNLLCGATRCLALNFNGAISAARSIVSAEFKCNQPFAVVMSSPQITTDGRECHCTIYAQNQGTSLIQVNATLDNGDVYNQLFVVNVSRPAYFQNDPAPTTGPYVLTVNA